MLQTCNATLELIESKTRLEKITNVEAPGWKVQRITGIDGNGKRVLMQWTFDALDFVIIENVRGKGFKMLSNGQVTSGGRQLYMRP